MTFLKKSQKNILQEIEGIFFDFFGQNFPFLRFNSVLFKIPIFFQKNTKKQENVKMRQIWVRNKAKKTKCRRSNFSAIFRKKNVF